VWSGEHWLHKRFRQGENPIISPEIVVRTALQKRVGGYDPALPRAADMEIYMRFAAHADVGFIRGVDQAYYRIHGENMRKSVSALMDLEQRRCVFELVLDRYGDRLSDVPALSEAVHVQLGREAMWAAGRVYDRGAVRRSAVGRRLLGAGPDEEERDVEELMAFAAQCWPDVKTMPLYRTLVARRSLGARGLGYLLKHKGEWWVRRRSWKYRGI
jgi:hypothetical protein